MRIAKFIAPEDIDPAELVNAAYFDLAEGVDPAELLRILVEKVELPPAEAQHVVGQQNGRLQELMLAIAERLERQTRPNDIVGELIDRDWPRSLATDFVTRIQKDLAGLAQTAAGREQLLAASRRRMLHGLAWFGGGILVTWVTQHEAEVRGGGSVLIAWGAILYGLALLMLGAYHWLRYKVGTRGVA